MIRRRAPACRRPSPLPRSHTGAGVVLSALWSQIADVHRTIAQLSATSSNGHVVQIVDPAEETFPYFGRIEFVEPGGAGSIAAGRAETGRADYEARIERHRAEIRAEADRLGWGFILHPTNRPAGEMVLQRHA